MIVHKITNIVNKTTEITGYPPELVTDVVGHTLKYTKDFLENPTHAGIRLRYFGVIRPKLKALNFYLKKLTSFMREEKTPELEEEFRKFWRLRRLLQQDNERRNFKKRFGSYHWR